MKIIRGYPCRNCGCWSVEEKTDCEYYWVNFGVVLVENHQLYIVNSVNVSSSRLPTVGKKRTVKKSMIKDRIEYL